MDSMFGQEQIAKMCLYLNSRSMSIRRTGSTSPEFVTSSSYPTSLRTHLIRNDIT